MSYREERVPTETTINMAAPGEIEQPSNSKCGDFQHMIQEISFRYIPFAGGASSLIFSTNVMAPAMFRRCVGGLSHPYLLPLNMQSCPLQVQVTSGSGLWFSWQTSIGIPGSCIDLYQGLIDWDSFY